MTQLAVLRAIVAKEIYLTFSNRSFVLFTCLTPVVLSLLFGAAFGGLNDPTSADLHIPIAIVNLDQGNASVNFGDVFVMVFAPNLAPDNVLTQNPANCSQNDAQASDNPTSLTNLINAVILTDPDVARQGVERGEFAAAIIIPADFSRKISYTPTHPMIESVQVEVFANSGNSFAAALIHSVVETITSQIVTGNLAIAATFETLQTRLDTVSIITLASNPTFITKLGCVFDLTGDTIRLDKQYTPGSRASLDLLTYIASGQAMFFLLFTALRGATDLLNERQQGTLQRMLAAPIPRYYILTGKLIGTFINCVLQLMLLGVALSIMNSFIKGAWLPIWGSDLLAILLVILAASFAASGLGMLVMALARNPAQANALTSLLTTFMAALGGAFFPVDGVPILNIIAKFSPIYHGADALYRLASGRGDIALNVVVLIVMGVVLFGIGFMLFTRQQKE